MNSEKDHIIKSYDTELERLNGEIANMGELAVKQLEAAVELVERRDERAARHVVENDDVIDDMEHQISHDVVRLLALRAPMARDLREVFAALRVASDIERIGDYATNIAKRSIPLSMLAPVGAASGLQHLSELAARAVRKVLQAYHDGDADAAYEVWKDDVRVDAAFTSLFRELLTYMMEDPRSITACTHLLFMAKNIERIGDHATNIAENVWYVVKGSQLEAPRKSADKTTTPDMPHLGERP